MFSGVITRVNNEYGWFRKRIIHDEYTPDELPIKGAIREWESTFIFNQSKILSTEEERLANSPAALEEFKHDILLNGNPARYKRISLYLDKDEDNNYLMKFAFIRKPEPFPKEYRLNNDFIFNLPLSTIEKAKEGVLKTIELPDFLKKAFLNEVEYIFAKGEKLEEKRVAEMRVMRSP